MQPRILGLHHDHVDGSMAVKDVIVELYNMAGKSFPFPTEDEWLAFMRDSNQDIVKRFDTVTSVLQTGEALELMGYAYGKRRAEEGYIYAEAKFAPQYHVRDGLSLWDAAWYMRRGLRNAENDFGIRIMPVICIGREAEPALGVEIANIAIRCAADEPVALDLVCDEAEHPPEKHFKAYQETFDTPVWRDCHAGEWVTPEPAATYNARMIANIWTAVRDLRCHGIGHAIPLARDSALMNYVANMRIRVAGCPLSNKVSGWVKSVGDLGIRKLLEAGVIYTLNADDDLFLPPMTEVIAECDRAYGFTVEECRKLELNVFRGAFGLDRTCPLDSVHGY